MFAQHSDLFNESHEKFSVFERGHVVSEVLSQITSRKLFKLECCSPKTRVVVSPLQLAKHSPIACGASAKKPTLIQAFPKPRAEGLPSIRQLARDTSKSCDTSASRPRSIQTGPKQGCLDSAPICSWSGPPQYSALLQRSSWLDSAHSGSRPGPHRGHAIPLQTGQGRCKPAQL